MEVIGNLHVPAAQPPGQNISTREYEAAMAPESGHETRTVNIQNCFLLSWDRNVNLSATRDTKTMQRADVMNAIQSILPARQSSNISAVRRAKFLMISTIWISLGYVISRRKFYYYFYFPILKELIVYVSYGFININNSLLVVRYYSSLVVPGFSINEFNSCALFNFYF
jgi:hypothetical protein